MARRGSDTQLTTNSVPILFAILYGIMLLYYIQRTIRNPTQVFISLSLFCAIRVTAFVLYAVTFGSLNSGLAIVTMIFFFHVGFIALLYSGYVLVLDREIASGNIVKNSISRVTSNRYFICFALAVTVSIAIAAFVSASQGNTSTLVLQETYVIISFVVTVLIGVQTVFQVNAEHAALKQGTAPSGRMYNRYIPCLILILLLIHEIYFVVRINLYIYSQALWWSLWALPELLAVFLFAIPDLVPEKRVLAPAQGHESDGCG